MKTFKKFVAVIMAAIMLLSATPVFAGSTGSISSDLTVGEDTAQNASTTYSETGEGTSQTDVYLTVDNRNIVVGVPTVVILSGTPNSNGEYVGNYSVSVSGDMSGDNMLVVEPDSDTVTVQQTGKNDVTGTIAQEQTEFDYADLTANTVTTGAVKAVGLTAGSWHGQFNMNIQINTSVRYYSSLALAVTDANNLILDNADVTAENAEAELRIVDDIAYIRILKNVSNETTLELQNNTVINLNTHSLTFDEGNNLKFNKNLSLLNGTIIGNNSKNLVYDVANERSGCFTSSNVSYITEVKTNVGGLNAVINTNVSENNIDNTTIDMSGNGSSSYISRGIVINNLTSTNSIVNSEINSTVKNANRVYGIFAVGNTRIENFTTDIKSVNASARAIVFNDNSTSSYMKNIIVYAYSDTDAYGVWDKSKTATIEGAYVYVDCKDKDMGAALSMRNKISTDIISTTELPVYVFGKNYGIMSSSRETNGEQGVLTINGGDYTSLNHIAYIAQNANIYDANFYCDNENSYTETELNETTRFGIYLGDSVSSSNYTVTFTRCRINKPDWSERQGSSLLTANSNNNYKSPKQVNIVDCDLYAGGAELFKYNYPTAANPSPTKFYILGNTKIYATGNRSEISQETFTEKINTWKNKTVYNTSTGKYNSSYIGHQNFVGGCCGNVDEDTGEVLAIYLSDDANVYDNR